MSDSFEQHKLAAIFYADIAGYSRLTAQDESGSHRRVMQTLDFASESIAAADHFYGALSMAGVGERG